MADTDLKQDIVEDIFNIIMDMHGSTGYSRFSTNEAKIRDLIKDRISNGFVYFDGKCLLMGNAYRPWFSDDICVSDTLLYTLKEFRGKGLAKIAVKSFIDWAKEIGSVEISLGQTTGVSEKEFIKMADSLGLKKIGAVYNV